MEYWNTGILEENVAGFGLKVNNTKLEYQGRAGKISRRGVDAKSRILSWNYQIVVQAPDFVIKMWSGVGPS